MLRRVISIPTHCALKMSVRCAGDMESAHGKYESEIVSKELSWKRRRRVNELIKAERKYVASLPGKLVSFS